MPYLTASSRQCACPLWDGDTPLADKRGIGAALATDPARGMERYCAHHGALYSRRGTPGERAAVRMAKSVADRG